MIYFVTLMLICLAGLLAYYDTKSWKMAAIAVCLIVVLGLVLYIITLLI